MRFRRNIWDQTVIHRPELLGRERRSMRWDISLSSGRYAYCLSSWHLPKARENPGQRTPLLCCWPQAFSQQA